jgi:5-methylcytosine-specific restriction endonuclease McrA
MTREAVLARDPICKVCDQRLSVEVDHIVPLSDGGAPWSLEGLQGICRPCHESKTGRENRRRQALTGYRRVARCGAGAKDRRSL